MPTFNDLHVESALATALTVARGSGVTDYGLQVDQSAASAAAGLKITAAAAGSGVALAAISSAINESLSLDAKGSGVVKVGGTSSGGVVIATGGGNVGIGTSTPGRCCMFRFRPLMKKSLGSQRVRFQQVARRTRGPRMKRSPTSNLSTIRFRESMWARKRITTFVC